MKTVYKVTVIESERNWGQKIDDILWFHDRTKADEYVKEHNAKNNKDYVPDIYWRAESPVPVDVPEKFDFHDKE